MSFRSDSSPLARAVAELRCGVHAALPRQVHRAQLAALGGDVRDRRQSLEVTAQDRVAATAELGDEECRVLGASEIAGRDDGGEVGVAEAGDDPRRPRPVRLRHAPERRIRVAAPPRLGIEVARAVVTEHSSGIKLRSVPRAPDGTEAEQILQDVPDVEVVSVTHPPPHLVGKLGTEAIPQVHVVVTHDSRGGIGIAGVVGQPYRHAVLLARIVVIGPRREQLGAAQVPPVLVRDDVAGVVVPGPRVRERAEHTPRKPARRHEAVVIAAAGGIAEQFVQHGVVERPRRAEVVRRGDPRLEPERRATDVDHRLAGNVPARRMVEARRDRGRPGRALVLLQVGLEHVPPSIGELDAEAGITAVRLAGVDEDGAVGPVAIDHLVAAGPPRRLRR